MRCVLCFSRKQKVLGLRELWAGVFLQGGLWFFFLVGMDKKHSVYFIPRDRAEATVVTVFSRSI